jgi:hypothetical protein
MTSHRSSLGSSSHFVGCLEHNLSGLRRFVDGFSDLVPSGPVGGRYDRPHLAGGAGCLVLGREKLDVLLGHGPGASQRLSNLMHVTGPRLLRSHSNGMARW